MNKIVVEHYPVSRLPEDLRVGLMGLRSVTLTIEEEPSAVPSAMKAVDVVRQLRAEKLGKRPEDGISNDEAVGRIRRLRNEWED